MESQGLLARFQKKLRMLGNLIRVRVTEGHPWECREQGCNVEDRWILEKVGDRSIRHLLGKVTVKVAEGT